MLLHREKNNDSNIILNDQIHASEESSPLSFKQHWSQFGEMYFLSLMTNLISTLATSGCLYDLFIYIFWCSQSPLPVGVPVAHCVVTRVLLVLLAHLEADPFNTTLLHFVLVAAILAGGQRGWLTRLVHERLSTVPLELRGFSDRWQEAEGKVNNSILIPKLDCQHIWTLVLV